MSEPFIAEIKIFAGNFAPRGYAFCDGQLLPISQFSALFSLIGTTYGGDGRSTTGLPNLMDRAPMHPGRGPGLTSRRLGERLGVPRMTLDLAQIPSHSHTAYASQNPPATADFTGNSFPSLAGLYTASNSGLQAMNDGVMSATGGSQSHLNEQPYITLNYIIALVGVYPSRG